jgi:hypothetical protein
MLHIAREYKMHESFCAQWGLSASDIAATPESITTTAYGTFILDAGLKGDDLSLIVALAACLLGYGEVGLWLVSESQRMGSEIILEGNPYRKYAACCNYHLCQYLISRAGGWKTIPDRNTRLLAVKAYVCNLSCLTRNLIFASHFSCRPHNAIQMRWKLV